MLEFLDFLCEEWHWSNYFVLKGKNVLRLELHTGGWSGNEDIIEELHSTNKHMFWLFHWQKSKRGGHYYFKINRKNYWK